MPPAARITDDPTCRGTVRQVREVFGPVERFFTEEKGREGARSFGRPAPGEEGTHLEREP
jgi:hypothetical protein